MELYLIINTLGLKLIGLNILLILVWASLGLLTGNLKLKKTKSN